MSQQQRNDDRTKFMALAWAVMVVGLMVAALAFIRLEGGLQIVVAGVGGVIVAGGWTIRERVKGGPDA